MIDYIDDDEMFSYTANSEIDKTIPHLDSLIEETMNRKKGYFEEKLTNPSFFKTIKYKFKKNLVDTLDHEKKYLHSKSFKKDGYIFRIKVIRVVEEDDFEPRYIYQFYATLKYDKEIRDKLLYEKFYDKDQATEYFHQMEGVFKHLRRRDLVERIFKDFEKKIKS
ncbi:MAG: hypothetical protein IJ565_06175 [Bacilli bacterium]|nr:hypothetical protein [Bacilli bacterium]